jgi:hypothetical protein
MLSGETTNTNFIVFGFTRLFWYFKYIKQIFFSDMASQLSNWSHSGLEM